MTLREILLKRKKQQELREYAKRQNQSSESGSVETSSVMDAVDDFVSALSDTFTSTDSAPDCSYDSSGDSSSTCDSGDS